MLLSAPFVKSPCWISSLEKKEVRRFYKRVAQIRCGLSKVTRRFIAAKDSSFPVPVTVVLTGLFWQCWEEWDQKTPICSRTGPIKQKRTKLSEHKNGGCSRRAVVVPGESRWHRGKVNAEIDIMGAELLFSLSAEYFQNKIWLSLPRKAASKWWLTVICRRLWKVGWKGTISGYHLFCWCQYFGKELIRIHWEIQLSRGQVVWPLLPENGDMDGSCGKSLVIGFVSRARGESNQAVLLLCYRNATLHTVKISFSAWRKKNLFLL